MLVLPISKMLTRTAELMRPQTSELGTMKSTSVRFTQFPIICALTVDGHLFQACRRCYDHFHIADAGRPAQLRTIRVDKAAVLRRHVEGAIRRALVTLRTEKQPVWLRFCSVVSRERELGLNTIT